MLPIVPFLAGLCLTGSAVLTLKVVYAAKPSLVAEQSSAAHSVFVPLLDSERHRIILEFLEQHLARFWNGWPLFLLAIALFLLCLLRRHRVAHVGTLACVAAMCVIYYLIIVTTPSDLHWQLVTAMDRLILQLWPVLMVGLGLLFDQSATKGAERVRAERGERPETVVDRVAGEKMKA